MRRDPGPCLPTVLAALLGATLAATPPAHAQEAESSAPPPPTVAPFEIGVFGGVHIFNEKSGLGRNSDSPTGLSPDTGGAFGLRLAFNLNRWIGFEGEGLIIPTRLRDDSTYVNVLGYRAQIIVTPI